MNRVRELALILALAIVIAASGSHLIANWLQIKTTAAEVFRIGNSNVQSKAFLAGSSLATYGMSWDLIAKRLDLEVNVWGIAGSSPYEWERFQKLVPEARVTFIVVSAYDLDEGLTCDFRAALV